MISGWRNVTVVFARVYISSLNYIKLEWDIKVLFYPGFTGSDLRDTITVSTTLSGEPTILQSGKLFPHISGLKITTNNSDLPTE